MTKAKTKTIAAAKDVIVVRPMLTLTATMDHRYIDGYHAARLARSVRAYFADPAGHEPRRRLSHVSTYS